MMMPHHLSAYLLMEDMMDEKKINSIKYKTERGIMTEKRISHEQQGGAGQYEIRLMGELDDRWADRLEDVVITRAEDGNSLLTCHVIDQAALYGLLKRVRDLGMPLLSVNRVESGPSTTLGTDQADVPDGKP